MSEVKMTRSVRARASRRTRELQRRRAYQHWLIGIVAIVGVVVAGIVTASLVRDDPERRPGTRTVEASAAPADPSQVRTSGAPRSRPLSVGAAIPRFVAPTLSGGGRVDWSSYAGRPAVVTIWAPWCPHCQAELPILADVMADHPDVGLVTVTTAVDPAVPPTPEEYLAQHDLDLVTAVDDQLGTLARAFGIQGFPTIYFVDRAGVVQRVVEGEMDRASLDQIVSGLG
jgi:thiol-disulfide isomerase/thioredoxin